MAAPAAAEKPDLVPRENYEAPVQRPSVPERATESLEPRGGRVGSFVVLPSAELTAGFDSNVFATNDDQDEDFFTTLVPALRLQSDFASPLRLNFDAVGVVRRYMDNDSEDTEGFLLGHNGSWEVPALGERSFFKWGLAHSRDWQDRGAPDEVAGAAEPTILHTSLGYLGFQYKPGPISISPRVSARHVDVDDADAIGGGAINNDDRDRWIYTQGVRLGYEFVRGYEGYVQGTVNQRRYEDTPDDAGFNRDSDGWETVAGLRVGLSEITSLDVFAGYLSQSYEDLRLSSVDGIGFGGRLNWSPRREWQVAASITRDVEETIQTDFSGYLATTYAINAAYQLHPQLRFEGRLSYSQFDFERISTSTADEREDDLVMGQLGVRYYLSPYYYVRLSYNQQLYESNVGDGDYERSIVYLTLGAQY